MPAFVDYSGRKFGRLTVISCERKIRDGAKETEWRCRCECGNEAVVKGGNLRNGSTNSCGCIKYTQARMSNKKHPMWKRWQSMIERCHLPSSKDFHNYGARGISVCDSWRHFPNFLEDMERGFFEGASLDRINNNGNYEPSNVRWATQVEQCNNTRYNRKIETPFGLLTIAEAARKIGIPQSNLKTRIDIGWTMEELFDPKNARIMNRWSRRKRHDRGPDAKQRIL